MKKNKLFLLIATLVTGFCSSCAFGKVKEIDFTLSKTAIEVGENCFIDSVTVKPTNAKNSDVVFTIEDPSVASIDGMRITGNKLGSTYVVGTATDGSGVQKSVKLDVVYIPTLVTNISLSFEKNQLAIGESMEASAVVTPSNADDIGFSLHAAPENVVSISNKIITGLKTGVVTIYAVANDDGHVISNYVNLSVRNPSTTGIQLNPSSTGLHIGDSVNLNAQIIPSNGNEKDISYKTQSGTNSIISVSSTGLVTATGVGEDYAIAYLTNKPSISAMVKFTVSPIEPVSISASVPKTKLYLDECVQITAQVYPTNAYLTDVIYRVKSGTNNVISVSSTGLIKGLHAGTDVIEVCHAERTNIKKEITITVLDYTDPLDPNGDDIYGDN